MTTATAEAAAGQVGRARYGSISRGRRRALFWSYFFLILFVLKLLVTALTLGSGASGGVFSPALYLGATLGGVYGLVLHQLFPGLPIHSAAFAVAGMAGVVGGTTGAALAPAGPRSGRPAEGIGPCGTAA